MKNYLILLLLLTTSCATAQLASNIVDKPILDFDAIKKWTSVEGGQISGDGQYVFYRIKNEPISGKTLVLKAVHQNWELRFPNVENASFTEDSRFGIFLKKDSLVLISLDKHHIEYIPRVQSFKTPRYGDGSTIAYLLNSPEHPLVLANLRTGKEKKINSIVDYNFSDNGCLLVFSVKKDQEHPQDLLELMHVNTSKCQIIWSSKNPNEEPGAPVFDKRGSQFIFKVTNSGNALPNLSNWWHFKQGGNEAAQLSFNASSQIDTSERVESVSGFSLDGKRLFLTLEKNETQRKIVTPVKVDVWSYNDSLIQSQQLSQKTEEINHAVYTFSNHRFLGLDEHSDQGSWPPFSDDRQDNWVLVQQYNPSQEIDWNRQSLANVYLVSTITGERRLVEGGFSRLKYTRFNLSPGGLYVTFYDTETESFLSYEVSSGIIKTITRGIGASWTILNSDGCDSAMAVRGIAAWLPRDSAVFIYDRYDIWQIDPKGAYKPTNVTNGFGRKNNLIFDIGGIENGGSDVIIQKNQKQILVGFNPLTKENGFYEQFIGRAGDPRALSMAPSLYYLDNDNASINGHAYFKPLKARNANAYLLTRQSATESPNFVYTADFVKFVQVSANYPETSYNWLKSELVDWKTSDGKALQGILYKPENFDPQKKYAVIFCFYERLSNSLNVFLEPEISHARLNVPFFVSKGYLVFCPDISFKPGETGHNALEAILSAAHYLSKMPFIDQKRMGLQGHSFGGFETDYIVTHSGLFAAACSASGVSDLISMYGSLSFRYGESGQEIVDRGQLRMSTTPWDHPEIYMENSPVFNADKVTTPILLMHNKEDDAVPFGQGVEFFLALRRLGKRVWMLQYDGQGHWALGNTSEDYTIRMTQFFDHYLRDQPAPVWMTRGIPAALKGTMLGYDYDAEIKTPKAGGLLITQKKYQ